MRLVLDWWIRRLPSRVYERDMTRSSYAEALERLALMERLAPFDPHVAGTPPLGLDLAASDLDVLCHAPNATSFAAAVRDAFGQEAGFGVRQWIGDGRPIVASFRAHGWTIDLFGHPRPVHEQPAWRHFVVEGRLLQIGGDAFRSAVMAQRSNGLKTEPAFAAALGLSGDPYEALLLLERRSDAELKAALADAGFAAPQ